MVEPDDDTIKYKQTWCFVKQKRDVFMKWNQINVGYFAENIRFPVLVRHIHETFEGEEELNWTKLRALWIKDSCSWIDGIGDSTDENFQICKLMNYCENHKTWTDRTADRKCSQVVGEDQRCEMRLYLLCFFKRNCLFRLYDPKHSFRPGMFG